ncbi:hypothetical protein ANN_25736 [Periplaneta americana]|uniref:Uncharacterized protein n=1 Tax=Periplaneta americana TaxID=6978 RepID=A0ABQ8S3Z8_PERAM|nr:hypothetical protein ANN_25736 [Periplaneta americana]
MGADQLPHGAGGRGGQLSWNVLPAGIDCKPHDSGPLHTAEDAVPHNTAPLMHVQGLFDFMDEQTDREPEDADSDLPAQNGEENPRTLPQRQDFQHQTKADDKHQRHGTPRGTPEMEMGRPRVETPRLQMGAYFHHVGSTHREAKPRKTWDQMGGLLQEPSWTPVVQNSQEPRRMEIATVCQYRVRVQVYTHKRRTKLI